MFLTCKRNYIIEKVNLEAWQKRVQIFFPLNMSYDMKTEYDMSYDISYTKKGQGKHMPLFTQLHHSLQL